MKRVITLALAGLLTACSSQMQMPSIDDILPSKELDRTMYLRGDFTLWDAEPQYQLEQVAPGIFQTDVKFSTPGKVYEFKVADADFSEGYNCGYSGPYRAMDQAANAGQKASCSELLPQ